MLTKVCITGKVLPYLQHILTAIGKVSILEIRLSYAKIYLFDVFVKFPYFITANVLSQLVTLVSLT